MTPPTQDALRRAAPWIVAAIGERLDLPPLGVIADVGALLYGDTMAIRRGSPLGYGRLDAAVRRYEDTLLGRLGSDTRLLSCADAIAKLPEDLRAQGVGIFVASLLDHLGFERGVTIQPGVLREATARGTTDVVARGLAAIHESAELRDSLADAYETLTRGAQRASALVTDADVFTLENLAVLRTLTQRLAVKQVVEARQAIDHALLPRIKSKRKSSGEAATREDAESEYPVGGFASVSTYGSIENIVTSELVYMDTPQGGGGRDRPLDLFDVRYAEGELLYYTRDEAILLRQRRSVVFLLADDLVAARVKEPTLAWQRIVALLGAIAAIIEKLARDLGGDALSFRVVFLTKEDLRSPLSAERDLCELLLREWRDKGMLSVVESTVEHEAADLAILAKHSLVETVFCSCDTTSFARWSSLLAATRGTQRVLRLEHSTGLAAPADLEAWRTAATALVAELL